MGALARSGDRNAALQVYREFVELLRSDPKAVPDEETSTLYMHLRAEACQQSSGHIMVKPKASVIKEAAVPGISGYLPQTLTDLVGREDERLEVSARLRRSRLVTLTGLGGIGKTRLAMEIAREVGREYPDGVWLVALEALTEGRQVARHVACVLGIREASGRSLQDSVTEHLSQKRLLLVLDNCEHLLEYCAQFARHLLCECEGVRILATSREALGITGETAWTVPGLAVPDPAHLPQRQATLLRVMSGYESVQLFVERAQAVQKTFALTGSNLMAVAQVCARLQGVPLAIEMAAARIKALAVEQIAARLDDHLGLLTTGGRAVLPRHQTLRATLDWSYALLCEAERRMLARVSVFAGSWSLEAAEALWPEDGGRRKKERLAPDSSLVPQSSSSVLDLLTSLIDKSLVVFDERDRHRHSRYHLLETVRQYAAERLLESGEAEQVAGRHRDWFLALAEEAMPHLKGTELQPWLRRLETDHDNLRTALTTSWSTGNGGEAYLRLVGALGPFWFLRGDYSEGRTYLGRAMKCEAARARTEMCALALHGEGVLATHQGDHVLARTLLKESLAIRRELADRRGIAESLNHLGNVAYMQSELAVAQEMYTESLKIRRELTDKRGIAESLNNLGEMAVHQGDHAAAHACFVESLTLYRDIGHKHGAADPLANLGTIMLVYNEVQKAVRLWAVADQLRKILGVPQISYEQENHARQLAQARASLGEEAFDDAWEEGNAMPWEQAIVYALP